MLPVKEATQRAIEFARTVLDPSRISGLRLEEVEMVKTEQGAAWLITLSMLQPPASAGAALGDTLDRVFGVGPREYKTFTVHGDTGEVLSMKIRELAGVQ